MRTMPTVTADVLQGFAIGLVPFSVYLFTLRGFYAQQNTRTPFFINTIENACNVLLALALFPALGVRGLSLAYAGAYAIAAVLALVLLQRRVGDLLPGPVRTHRAQVDRRAPRRSASSRRCAPGAIGHDTPVRAAIAAAVGAVAGGIVYVAVLAALRSDELRGLARVLRRRGASRTDV